jgi:hypothetical protein
MRIPVDTKKRRGNRTSSLYRFSVIRFDFWRLTVRISGAAVNLLDDVF